MNDRAQSKLGVCAIFKDEARYLDEWLAFHQAVGVRRFYLYDNGSTDDWWEVLEPYYAAGVAQVVHWPGRCAQLLAYRHALRAWGPMVKWLAFIDLDEFLFCPDGAPLPDALGDYCGFGAVGVCWMVYGTGGVSEPGGLVTEGYQFRSAEPILNRHVKSIVRTARAIDRAPLDPHHLFVDGDCVDELGRVLDGPFAKTPTHDRFRINHYVSKSEAEARAKMLRPRADNGELRNIDLLDPLLNAVHDPAILPWVPVLKERLGR